ncbi:lipid droplet-associated hydrolase-like [Octopus sinensis]|uniref:Lipid droplet-associated hydrolase n=1 Tax=Octopus sinensis TaxID=2607531 RepID=A0A6P7UA88_9MOLL|nr:lipid droplet-associated hydrolase-like [Octopus sinensis]
MESISTDPRLEWFQLQPGVEFQVMKFGSPPATSSMDPVDSPSDNLMFLVIPGNPGVVGYYEKFMATLYQKSNQKIPVWGISHTGHVSRPSEGSHNGVYSLQDQIEHKLAFLHHHIPKNVSLILIGHSIGCYMILNMLKKTSHNNILRCFFLFPTIERMSSSPQGKVVTPFLKLFRWILLLFVYFMSFLPLKSKQRILCWYFKDEVKYPRCIYASSLNLFDVSCVNNMISMASQEMDMVKELDSCTISKNLHKICFYYGRKDRWCPLNYCDDMKKHFPKANIRVCQEGFEHAFVITDSERMADITWEWMQCELQHSSD